MIHPFGEGGSGGIFDGDAGHGGMDPHEPVKAGVHRYVCSGAVGCHIVAKIC